MKNVAYVLLLIGISWGCRPKNDISPKTAPVDNAFGLKYKDKTIIKIKGLKSNSTLELSELEDGRCIGKNIVCVWGGDIFVTLLLDNDTVIRLRLNGPTLDQLTSSPVPARAGYAKEARIKLNNVPCIIRLEQVDVKNLNEEWAGLTPKENYTVWLKIFKD